MWWYNILVDHGGSIYNILRLGTITVGSIFLNDNLHYANDVAR